MKEKTLKRAAPPVDPSSYEEEIPVKLAKAADALRELAGMLLGDIQDLGFIDFRILAHLTGRTSASIGDISRELQVDKAWISRRLQVLGARQLIQKSADPSDSRVTLASITDTGRGTYETAFFRLIEPREAIMEGLDEALISDIVDRLDANIRKVAARLRAREAPRPG